MSRVRRLFHFCGFDFGTYKHLSMRILPFDFTHERFFSTSFCNFIFFLDAFQFFNFSQRSCWSFVTILFSLLSTIFLSIAVFIALLGYVRYRHIFSPLNSLLYRLHFSPFCISSCFGIYAFIRLLCRIMQKKAITENQSEMKWSSSCMWQQW